MIKQILDKYLTNKKLVKPLEFVIKMSMVYVSWRVIKHFGTENENFLWGGWNWIMETLGSFTIWVAAKILLALGYSLTYYHRFIAVDGTSGIYFADLCLGVAPMVIFSGFIVSFGNHTKNKLWFIPLGVSVIFIINVIRLIGLVLIQVHGNRAMFRFTHDYLYVLVTYGFIFLMLVWWMEKLADKKLTDSSSDFS